MEGTMSEIVWAGVKPEDRRMKQDYCRQCGITRGPMVLNYNGPCVHVWETVEFAPIEKEAVR